MEKAITIIGGDSRFLHTEEYFRRRGYKVNSVFLYGNENRPAFIGETVILPLPCFKDGFLNAPFHGEKIDSEALLSMIPQGAEVFGGMFSNEFCEKLKSKNINFKDYYKDETLLCENAVLTAKGLKTLLINSKIGIEYEKALILGFGRCGKAIASVFSFSGADVTVVSSKADGISEYKAVPFEKLKNEISKYRIIVNTVPSRVIGEKELKNTAKNAVLAEIASAPYGIDEAAAEKYGIKIIKAPSLPGRFFPKEAGEAIAKTVELLREGG